MAGRVWRAARWLGQILFVSGLIAAGVWWGWMYSLLVWGGASTITRFGLPTAIVVVYTGAAMFSGRGLARSHHITARARGADELEPASR